MGKLLTGSNWFLTVRTREHYPCHFHVIGPDFQAQVDTVTLEVMEGTMPRAIQREALNWANANREVIVAEWNLCNPDRYFTLEPKEKPDE